MNSLDELSTIQSNHCSSPLNAEKFYERDIQPKSENREKHATLYGFNDVNATSCRQLSCTTQISMIADFDAGMLPHELEIKYGATKAQVATVLRDRIPVIRHQASSPSDRITLKRRRTSFVGLNVLMWQYFCECRDRGIILNGRQLKEQALAVAKNLGLHNFKGSEGWLDSFKRRHNIDLKTMSGQPVIYEMDGDNSCPDERSPSHSPCTMVDNDTSVFVDANRFLMEATNIAAGLQNSGDINESVNNNSNLLSSMANCDIPPCQATVAVHTTRPLDLTQMLMNVPNTSVALQPSSKTQSTGTPLASEMNLSSIQALLQTCSYRADEAEVSHAIETLRSYIIMNDVGLLPLLVEMQRNLSIIAERKKEQKSISNLSIMSDLNQQINHATQAHFNNINKPSVDRFLSNHLSFNPVTSQVSVNIPVNHSSVFHTNVGRTPSSTANETSLCYATLSQPFPDITTTQ